MWAVILAAAVIRLWILPLRSGFWLDETGTAWTIRGGAGEVIARSLRWPSQMPLYSLLEWAVSKVAGMHEWALRFPSLLAAGAATWMLYRVAKRFLNREAALLAAVIFACSEPVYFAAADARSYALGVAAMIGSSLLLLRWLERPTLANAAGYSLAAAFMLYMHYSFGVALAVHAIWVLYCAYQGKVVKWAGLMAMAGATILLLVPVWPHLRVLLTGGGMYGFAATPRGADLMEWFAPPVLVCALLAGLLASGLLFRRFELASPAAERNAFPMLVAWAAVPALLIYLVSTFTGLKMFLPRYMLSSVPGIALLAAWAFSAIRPPQASLIAAALFAIFTVASAGVRDYAHGGDWRQAINVVNRVSDHETPVLVRSGFVESTSMNWWEDSERFGFLFAPLTVYPVKGNVVRLPYSFNNAAREHL
ncbi:MAG: glycosyltransferase family 39 protein, partial [Acidobacteriia bacterium]|nr:glycosyltransferase family 39 protein [Terriglobia bacterium]